MHEEILETMMYQDFVLMSWICSLLEAMTNEEQKFILTAAIGGDVYAI